MDHDTLRVLTLSADISLTGRYVTVYIYQTGDTQHALTLCELQVFGKATPGKSALISVSK